MHSTLPGRPARSNRPDVQRGDYLEMINKKHVDFEQPPVIEVVCGVSFTTPPGFTVAHIGRFWEELGSDFGEVGEVAPLVAVAERFDGSSEDGMTIHLQPSAISAARLVHQHRAGSSCSGSTRSFPLQLAQAHCRAQVPGLRLGHRQVRGAAAAVRAVCFQTVPIRSHVHPVRTYVRQPYPSRQGMVGPSRHRCSPPRLRMARGGQPVPPNT